METIRCSFTRFLGASKTFAAARYENGQSLDEVKVSGQFNALIEEGEWFVAEGRWRETVNRKTNKPESVFNAYNIYPGLPITRKGVSQLLLNTFTKDGHGVDFRAVQAFVEKHGPGGALAAERKPEILLDLSVDPKLYGARILKDWARRISAREILRILESTKIPKQAIQDIIGHFRDSAMAVLRRDPFEFAKVPGVPFDEIDKLARSMGVPPNDERRVRAVLTHLAGREDSDGHTFVPYSDLKGRFKDLGITGEALKPVLARPDGDVVVRKDHTGSVVIQKRNLRDAEIKIARRLAEMMARRDGLDRDRIDRVTDQILAKDAYANIRKDPSQVEAIRRSVREPVAVLTGGPGTGKSTVTEAIAEILSSVCSGPVLLAAPAGKAARRQEEATKFRYKASTVHSLLKAKGRGLASQFRVNRTNPLPAGCFVIIDESSMLDVETAAALLDSIPPDGRILFVGDEAQLQSVGAGNFFGDVLHACAANGNRIPMSRLEKVHRNSAESMIAHYAKQIRENKFAAARLDNVLRGGVAFYDYPDREITDKIVALVSRGARRDLGLDPKKDVAVLCPKKDGNAGTWQLNAALSQALNPSGRVIEGFSRLPADKGEPIPRVHDRVMLTENDGENGVSNGDVGTIVDAGRDPHNANKLAVWVDFDNGTRVAFTISEARKLILAYAITGHKSQGSQYPLVVMPMTMDHRVMLDKNLVYTQWTRAKDNLIIVGDKDALEYGVGNITASERRTCLRAFLAEELSKLAPYRTEAVASPAAAPAPRRAFGRTGFAARAAASLAPEPEAPVRDVEEMALAAAASGSAPNPFRRR